jgi:hypothetical protein
MKIIGKMGISEKHQNSLMDRGWNSNYEQDVEEYVKTQNPR